MKIRAGFVSNSSSASFSIMLKDLSPAQLFCLKNHIRFAQDIGWDGGASDGEKWDVEIDECQVGFNTWMDNFDLKKFATDVIGIDENVIRDYDGPMRY